MRRVEACAEAYDQMSIAFASAELEQEFAALDTVSVDAELEALRKELNP